MYIYTHTQTHTQAYICTHMYAYIYTHTSIHMYTNTHILYIRINRLSSSKNIFNNNNKDSYNETLEEGNYLIKVTDIHQKIVLGSSGENVLCFGAFLSTFLFAHCPPPPSLNINVYITEAILVIY